MEAPRSSLRPHSSARNSKARQARGTKLSGSNSSRTESVVVMSNHTRTPNITRPGSVPLLWDKNGGDLAVHSTPLLLATRSLTSARSSTSSSASRPATGGRRRRAGDVSHHGSRTTKRRYPPVPKVEDLQSLSTPSLDLVGTQPADVDTSSRSLSPDVDKFLLDVNSALQNQSPSPPPVPAPSLGGRGATESSQHKGRNKPRPVVVAKFTGGCQTLPPEQTSAPLKVCSREGNGGTEIGTKQSSTNGGHVPPPATLPSADGGLGPQAPSNSSSVAPAGVNDSGARANAATRIQRWYRRQREAVVTREVQSFLQGKKDKLNRSRMEEQQTVQNEADLRLQREAELQKRRVAKMQAVRKAAIEDLQKRREEKRQEVERIAHEEIALLQASGKIRKAKTRRKKPGEGKDSRRGNGEEGKTTEDQGKKKTAETSESAIDEFFEAGDSRQRTQPTSSPPPAHPPGDDKPRSTYDDILDTLRLLEEEPTPLNPTDGKPVGYLSAQNLHRLDKSDQPPLTNEKLRTILSYLDEIEKSDSDLISQVTRPHSDSRTRAFPTPDTAVVSSKSTPAEQGGQREGSHQLSKQLDAATAVASDVTTTIMAQRMELDNKQKTVEMLQKALSQQRELTVYHAKEMEKEGRRRLDLQQREYEETIQRHQSFIDQLIDDKKVLSERCGTLVTELREMDVKYKQKFKTLEESHVAELNKVKQVSAAADKLRRERWRSEETQRIKEATVKGLEPEIQRIIAKGKAEIQKLKAIHEAELLQADERASRRFVVQTEELRAQCAREKEQACAHERELARQRYEKLAEQEEISYQQQRRKLFQEVQQEKERLSATAEQQRADLEREWRELREAQEREMEDLKAQHARTLEEAHRRHGSELRDLEERLMIERQSWEENYRKRQEVAMMEKERGMRETVRRERDKEIEMVIARLEEETGQTKAECERAAEARIKRVREKYETELREVERSERSTLERFNTMRGELTDREGELARVRSLLRQKEAEVEQIGQVASKLTRERDSVTDVVRQEFADRLVSTEEENKHLKLEMSELRARHRMELERVHKEKERGMEEVHNRVKQALARKEDNLKALRAQHEAALKRADHLEMLLERQRKELLRK